METIGSYAFYYCTGLTDLTVGSGIESVESGAFYNCSGLTNINWNSDFKNVPFSDVGKTSGKVEIVFGEATENISNQLFDRFSNRNYYEISQNTRAGEKGNI